MAVFPTYTGIEVGCRCLDEMNAPMLVKKKFHLAHTHILPEDVQCGTNRAFSNACR